MPKRATGTQRPSFPVTMKFRHAIRGGLLRMNYWSAKIGDPNELRAFIRTLHPRSSNVSLRRIGGEEDGGYLVPNDLDGIGAMISPGVSTECSFDKAIADMGIDVHMADASVAAPPEHHDRFHFSKLFLDIYDSDNTITLDEFCKDVAPGRDLLLQMDIEGAEWRVLTAVSDELLARVRILLLEVHSMTELFNPFGLQQIAPVFRRLARTHEIVHIHPNNYIAPARLGDIVIPPVLEFTFHRKDRATFGDEPTIMPHPLDAPNTASYPDYPLPDGWYRKAQ